MRGKRAKQLRKLAATLLRKHGISPVDLKQNYNQEMNCISWEPATGKDGKLIRDPDGQLLLAPKKKHGTITHAHAFMIAYRRLKKHYKSKGSLK